MTAPSMDSPNNIDGFTWEVGVDTGGTFTDCIARARDGRMTRSKVLSISAVRARIESIESLRVTVVLDLELADELIDSFLRGFSVRRAGLPTRSASDPLITRAQRIDVRRVELTLDRIAFVALDVQSTINGACIDLVAPFEAPLLALRLAIERPHPLALNDCRICIGTTRGTNALLEGKITPVTLCITEGLEDLLRIGDQRRLDIFAQSARKAPAIEQYALGVPARMTHDGHELRKLDEPLLRARARAAVARGDRTAAVALMHCDPSRIDGAQHEVRVGEILRDEGFEWISLSHRCGSSSRFEPRARAAVVDAALSGPVGSFIASIRAAASGAEILMMTSAGGLITANAFQPRESLLSGPAGGVAGAVASATLCGLSKCVTLDMGGTSADVARIDGVAEMRDETTVASTTIASPCVAVESVAAGGGSILWWDGESMRVGPRSAGASPGPACYGSGGPLTLTDANLLLGRIEPSQFAIPISVDAARERALELHSHISGLTSTTSLDQMLAAFIAIADESMASAIRAVTMRRGVDPAHHALVAFGGAGGLHACAVAQRLGIKTIVLPADAGLLCASGIASAAIVRIVSALVLAPLDGLDPPIVQRIAQLRSQAHDEMRSIGINPNQTRFTRQQALMRPHGYEESIEVDIPILEDGEHTAIAAALLISFRRRFRELYGFDSDPHRIVEIERMRVQIEAVRTQTHSALLVPKKLTPITGPSIVMRKDSSAFIAHGWTAQMHPSGAMILTHGHASPQVPASAMCEIVAAQLISIASDMGEQLRRTAVSPNVKDRLDFSCGILDADGSLVVNAPHIPIHLGSLGPCVRAVCAMMTLKRGDVVAVNHPRYGGSHLPDITVITPIYCDDNQLIGFAANRAHHAEIGGTRPGSMPPDATTLAQEGVVIEPTLIVNSGVASFDSIEHQLRSSRWPSRLVNDNLADLRAQVAANELAVQRLRTLVVRESIESFRQSCSLLRQSSRSAAERAIALLPPQISAIEQRLDDGTLLRVAMRRLTDPFGLEIDFTSTAAQHSGNLNAPESVTRAAVMYCIRVLVGRMLGSDGPAFPLNEGLLDPVVLKLPRGTILSPDFSGQPEQCPACAIGQTETSQRLVDLLWLAFDLAACSQGTINNLLFGNARFGFYETIAGGAGATSENDGENGVHTHISNTRITDAQVLERRYPVRLESFHIRRGSGGAGLHRGGDGLVRRIRFLESVDLSFLSQHRVEEPFGLDGGAAGSRGRQRIIRADGRVEEVAGIVAVTLQPGDQFEIETPGGGGWGAPNPVINKS